MTIMIFGIGLYILASLSAAMAQTNLVENPGFETGTLSPWTGAAQVLTALQTRGLDFFPHSGKFYA
jgi:hypothetical protein